MGTFILEKILMDEKTFSSGAYNETKYDNLARSMAMMEDELNRTDDRVKVAESRVVDVEAELQNIGNNQKQLEVSEEKARQREEKYQVMIFITNHQPWV